jgi:ribulose-phosphate 3-epimerase
LTLFSESRIGNPRQRVKLAAGLFWADYSALGAQVREIESAGADWIHIEVRDGQYMQFGMPRGGIDVLEAARASTTLEIEAQLQMVRPTQEQLRQMAEAGVNLISLPIETCGETIVEHIFYIRELGLKVGVWGWEGIPMGSFEPLIPFVDIVEYETWYPFWKSPAAGSSPHRITPTFGTQLRQLHDMIVDAGCEQVVDLMMDGGVNASNCAEFVKAGMTVAEMSSPLFKGTNGKLKPGTGEIPRAVARVRQALDQAGERLRTDEGLRVPESQGDN